MEKLDWPVDDSHFLEVDVLTRRQPVELLQLTDQGDRFMCAASATRELERFNIGLKRIEVAAAAVEIVSSHRQMTPPSRFQEVSQT